MELHERRKERLKAGEISQRRATCRAVAHLSYTDWEIKDCADLGRTGRS